ncbi:DNA-binding transcriptional regulator YhcF (GntR family) [Natronobacillus azotifigens]|uniref:GntR family transcriptional regulator n=1 Tax=Natronobacillus azotifigens TaxID=472978 RepID=A0A9J6RGA2_9BACI|nr:GntR family transcriptional regulator [Natronobacillus azotifigens]MCZ0704632.1 GntR family transcriptional regulator [Natronobacillus azotifigens]
MKHEFKEALTIYKQIALNIETLILEGVVKPGDRLSSLRESAMEMEVNVNTIMRAYNLLEEEGILSKKRGLGFFVSEEARSIIQKKQREAFYQYTVPELAKTLAHLEIDVEDLVEALNKQNKKGI